MKDIESLGSFYLGREVDLGQQTPSERPYLYDARDLTTHALCVGMTGSGKTGLCLSLIEEAALDNVPVIAIDPKGDLGNLGLRFANLDASSFEPWVDTAEAARKGQTPEAFASAQATLWKDGLRAWGQDEARIARSLSNAELRIYTPGSNAGLPLSILTELEPPADAASASARERLTSTVQSLLALVGVTGDPLTNREHVFLANVIEHHWQQGKALSLADLVRAIAEPPFSQLGVLDVETFYPASERRTLMMRFNGLLASPGFAAWTQGMPLDIDRLLYSQDGKPRISVLSIAHLSDAERMFFVSLVLGQLVAWMRTQSGTSSLRAILYMDEVFGYFPPVQNPPSKPPMLTLLKQARAYGLGVVLATQNPVDVDYKGLSNCGTWFLGRLQTERDKQRLLEGLASADQAAAVDVNQLSAQLSSLPSRTFIAHNVHEKAPTLFHTRWAMSYLRGPLTLPQIGTLMDPHRAEPRDGSEDAPSKQTGASSSARRPVCPKHIDERVLDTGPELQPALLVHAKLHYRYRYSDLDTWTEKNVLFAHQDGEPRLTRNAQVDHIAEVEADGNASFAELPARWLDNKAWKDLAQTFEAYFYEHALQQVYRSEDPKLYSSDGETKEAFAGRVAHALREARDEKIDTLRAKFDKQRERLEGRITTAQERVEKERAQYESAKVQSTISIGGSILGALFGRKGSVVSSARSVGRAAAQKGDIARAEQKVERLVEDVADLDEELGEQIEEIRTSALEPNIETMDVAPLKSDISVSVMLAWVSPERTP